MNKEISNNKEDELNFDPLAYLVLFIGALVLIFFSFNETQWVATNRGWFLQPRVAVLFGLIIFAFFTLIRLIQYRSLLNFRYSAWPLRLVNFIDDYRTALISSITFLIYLKSLSIFGFALSTLLFVSTLLWFSQLLNRTWFLVSLFTVITLVLIFRVGVSVWLPEAWLYELLPDALADFANQYL